MKKSVKIAAIAVLAIIAINLVEGGHKFFGHYRGSHEIPAETMAMVQDSLHSALNTALANSTNNK